MRAIRRYLPLVALAGLLAGVLPGLAAGVSAPDTASFTAQDFSWEITGSSSHQATIAMGGTVSFGYPSGASAHNADFGGSAPSACTQTAGSSSGAVPSLPATPTAAGWTGTCTFASAGTYTFHCDLHPGMSGSIVVVDPNAPPPTTTTNPPPPTTTTTNPPPPAPPTTTGTQPTGTVPGTSTPGSGTTTAPSTPTPGSGTAPLPPRATCPPARPPSSPSSAGSVGRASAARSRSAGPDG